MGCLAGDSTPAEQQLNHIYEAEGLKAPLLFLFGIPSTKMASQRKNLDIISFPGFELGLQWSRL